MRGSSSRSFFRLPVLLALTSLIPVLIAGSSVSAAPGTPKVVRSGAGRITAAQVAATRAYWTPQRMAAAKPYPFPKGIGNPGVHADTAGPTGKAGAIAGKAPSSSRTG